jgi:thymidylate synthase
MISIMAMNVNDAYPLGIMHLRENGVVQKSQHGSTLEMSEPVSVMYLKPRERILFDPVRDSNPFLNMFEALWLIQGRNDVEFLKYLVDDMKKYSDDGETYYGAYGKRMFSTIGTEEENQVSLAIKRLRENPDDRQVVIMIREADDMGYYGKDNPCNLLISCKIRNNKLNIHVFNRSNDFVWGMTGTNVVQFSMLQEYMAGLIGVEVGTYHQTTDSMHVYDNPQWDKVKNAEFLFSPYGMGDVKPCNMMENPEHWDNDLQSFFDKFDNGSNNHDYQSEFFNKTVKPMWKTFYEYRAWKNGVREYTKYALIESCNNIQASDWRLACKQWLSRRKEPV